jgi:hypothetical protein
MGPVERELRKLARELDTIDTAAKNAQSGEVEFYMRKIRSTTDDIQRKLKRIARKVRTLEADE